MTASDQILHYDPVDKEKHVTISTYEKWRKAKEIVKIADFIYNRHYHRYIRPFEFDEREYKEKYKNGFAIMANCCLLIETLESFYRGWANSKNKSETAFLKFFTRANEFKEFATDDMPTQFYKHIRCGILHQAETTGRWTISRSGSTLLDKPTREINAVLFSEQLKKSLEAYKDELKANKWNSPIWRNVETKIKSILKNCKHVDRYQAGSSQQAAEYQNSDQMKE